MRPPQGRTPLRGSRARRPPDAAHGGRDAAPAAQHQPQATPAPHPPVPAQELGERSAHPSGRNGHRLRAHGARLRPPGRGAGLDHRDGPGAPGFDHDAKPHLHRSARGGTDTPRSPRSLQHPSRQRIQRRGVHRRARARADRHQRGRHRLLERRRVHRAVWRSNTYEKIHLHACDSVPAARGGVARHFTFYNVVRPNPAMPASRQTRLNPAHRFPGSQRSAAFAISSDFT